ncbi:MAG: class I SAM-dependent methyltransferase [Candidatus Margulisbacteria bacterium]|nr:class I SAM-dependent methyltransferase [Candidatus Margulisiibacteriota bacterium]
MYEGLCVFRKKLIEVMRNNSYLKYQYFRMASFLATNGIGPPLASPAFESCSRWQKQGTKGSNDHPETYIEENNSTIELFKEVLPYLDKNSRILEIGCNVGRSLNYLYKLGYRDLTGIEIGEEAVKLARVAFPDMAQQSKLIVGNAPLELRKFPSRQFDLVFCHSVLVNIHPRYNYVFREMARVSRKFVLTLENEGSFLAYPRDFQKLFERVGLKMVASKIFTGVCERFPVPYRQEDALANNTIRLFVKDETRG